MTARQPAAPLLAWIRPGQWLLIDTLAGVGYGMLAFVALANGASSAGGWLAAVVGRRVPRRTGGGTASGARGVAWWSSSRPSW